MSLKARLTRLGKACLGKQNRLPRHHAGGDWRLQGYHPNKSGNGRLRFLMMGNRNINEYKTFFLGILLFREDAF